jgi:hypothetical protein
MQNGKNKRSETVYSHSTERKKTFNSFIYFKMAFLENKHSSGKSRTFLTASSTTIKKGDALTITSGYVTPVTASVTANSPIVIAEKDVTTASGEHLELECILVDPTLEFLADTDAATAQAQVGASYKFKSAGVVDNATAG